MAEHTQSNKGAKMPLAMNEIRNEHTKSPPAGAARAAHDWRTEPWLNEDAVSDFDLHAGMTFAIAISADGDDAQDTEDNMVFNLLRPDLMEWGFRSSQAEDLCRYRVAHAFAQAIAEMRKRWVRSYGSLDASVKGRPARCGGGGE